MNKYVLLLSTIALSTTIACGADTEPEGSEQTADGVDKFASAGAKADAFDRINNPDRFQERLNYKFDELPESGEIANTPWTATYWPMYEDGINSRWQGKDVLSPAEKYDKAFNGWTPDADFMNLKPFDTSTCEWDDAYYEGLGPAAKYADRYKGNWRAHNGIDDDGDGVSDKDECSTHENGVTDYDGVETWFGLCHAWAPAALLEPEPLSSVTQEGVTFDVSDLKALMISMYDRTSAYGIGARCNIDDKEFEFDEDGRITDQTCADMNAGAIHVIITNFIGVNKQGFVLERTIDYEVWNQPVRGYEIREQEEISMQDAYTLLDIDDPDANLSEGNGIVIQGVEEESKHAQIILRAANELTFEQLDDDARLYKNEAKFIAEYRSGLDGVLNTRDDVTIGTLQELDDIKYVGKRAVGRLLGYALTNGYVEKNYKYNQNAERFVRVKMALNWITEQSPSVDRTDDQIDRYTRTDVYDYILELDADGNILGGEYFGASKRDHADFIWLPVSAGRANPGIELAKVRAMIKESRENVMGGNVNTTGKTYESTERLSIPDADDDGVSSTLTVPDSGVVRGLKVNLNISHTYRGDIMVALRHGAIEHVIYDGRKLPSGERSSDDVVLTDLEVIGFNSNELKGDWTLVVHDMMRQDVGTIEDWSLNFDVE